MLSSMKVLGGMLILGRITATDMSTLEAESEMHPRVTHFETFLATRSARVNIAYGIEVGANWI
jgi:hypothetical protein